MRFLKVRAERANVKCRDSSYVRTFKNFKSLIIILPVYGEEYLKDSTDNNFSSKIINLIFKKLVLFRRSPNFHQFTPTLVANNAYVTWWLYI